MDLQTTSTRDKPYTLPYSKTTGVIKLYVHILMQLLCFRLLIANLTLQNCAFIPLAIFFGMMLGDLAGGMAHWTLDNYAIVDSITALMPGAPFIAQYIAHHDHPDLILKYDFWTTNSDGLYATSIVLTIVYTIFNTSKYFAPYTFFSFLHSPAWTTWPIALLVFWMVFLLYTGFTNQFHKWSHLVNPPPIVAMLQKYGFVLTFAEHHRHHIDPSIGYCLTTGWCNYFLEKIGYWRALDSIMIKCIGRKNVEEHRKVENRINFVKSITKTK